MRTIIDIKGIIQKEGLGEISNSEYEMITDLFLTTLENKGYCFAGGFSHISEEEYLDGNKVFDCTFQQYGNCNCENKCRENEKEVIL